MCFYVFVETDCKNSLNLFNISEFGSGGTSMGKRAFWYSKLKLSGDHLYVIRITFRHEAQKIESQKSANLINYSLKWLISLSQELFVL